MFKFIEIRGSEAISVSPPACNFDCAEWPFAISISRRRCLPVKLQCAHDLFAIRSRAVLSLAGGDSNCLSDQQRNASFALHSIAARFVCARWCKANDRFTVNAGFLYQFQTELSSFANLSPRRGVNWSLDERSTWLIHLRAGLFSSAVDPGLAIRVDRLNGTRQQEERTYRCRGWGLRIRQRLRASSA